MRTSKKTSKLRATGLCEGNSPATGEFPHKGPVTRKMSPFDDVIIRFMSMIHLVKINAIRPIIIIIIIFHGVASLAYGIGSTVVSYLFRPQRDIWRNFRHWWHRKLWRRHPPAQPCSDKKKSKMTVFPCYFQISVRWDMDFGSINDEQLEGESGGNSL